MNETKNFGYTGSVTCAYLQKAGRYKLEVWGAQGSSSSGTGGYGGYSVGTITASVNSSIYVVVGGQANYNGGGSYGARGNTHATNGAVGGGATHIATKAGVLSSLSSANDKKTILIVAGGGGGGGGLGYKNAQNDGQGNGGNGGSVMAQGTEQTQSSSYGALAAVNNSGFGATLTTVGNGGKRNSTLQNETLNGGCNTPGGGGGAGGGGGGYFGGGGGAGGNTYSNYGVNGSDGNFGIGGTGGKGSNPTGGCGSEGGGGGGGGSSFLSSSLTNQKIYVYTNSNTGTDVVTTSNHSSTATANYLKDGNGYAKITYLGT